MQVHLTHRWGDLSKWWAEKAPLWLKDYPKFAPFLVGYAVWRFSMTYVYIEDGDGVWQWKQQVTFFASLFLPMLILGPMIFWTAHRFRLESRPRWTFLVGHLVSMTVYCGLNFLFYVIINIVLISGIKDWPQGLQSLLRTQPLYLGSLGWVFFLAGVTFAHGLTYFREARWRAAQQARLEAQLVQSQLRQLKSQIHPHFLFNTHSAISALMSTDVAASRRMLSLLSDFLRLALQEVATHIVPLRRELDFTDLYLEIQKLRFTDRLNVIREIDPGVLDWPVPHLLLQPLVENAIIHGFGRKIEPGTVRISARREREHLLLQVIDDGMGLKAPIGSGSCAGLGLKNARERLSQLYGQDGRLDCSEGPGGGFVVAMRIPCVGSMLNPKQVQP